MLVILYTSLFIYMVFFSICVAPVINKTLDRKNSSKLLRKIFPQNFIFGALLSLIIIFISVYYKSYFSLIISIIVFSLFIINLYVLVPKINTEADKTSKLKNYSRKFKIYHLISVFIYLIQILISFTGILIFN